MNSSSLDKVVLLTVRLSVFIVTFNPASKNSLMGYSSADATAFVCRLLIGQSSMPMPFAESCLSRSPWPLMAIPWPILAAPASTASMIFCAFPHSPAWIVKGSPSCFAYLKSSMKPDIG